MIEILIVGILLMFMLGYTGKIDANKFLKDNSNYFNILREDDYDFLVRSRYGDSVDPDRGNLKKDLR